MPSHTTILRGSAHPQTAFYDHDIIALREAYKSGESTVSLSIRYDLSESQIRRIIRGTSWAHLTGGTNIARRKITPAQVRQVISRYESDPSISKVELGREFGISRQWVRQILTGQGWPEITQGINRLRKVAD